MVAYKTCSKCKESKDIDQFRKDRTKKDGYYPSCNDCHRKTFGIRKGYKRQPRWVWRVNQAGYMVTGDNIRQHRYVMEKHLGRKLESWEHVHHINHVKTDNRLDNLVVLSAAEHGRVHTGKIPKGSVMKCVLCGKERYYYPKDMKHVSQKQYRCYSCYTTKHLSRTNNIDNHKQEA